MQTRTFVVTGATKGIGRAVTERLCRQGHSVHGLARHDPGPDFPGRFHAVDLADRRAAGELFQELAAAHSVDGLVNNVGLIRPAPLEEATLEDFDAVMDLNLRTALQAAQAFVPGMRLRGFGRVVNIASLVILGAPQRTAYAAAKSGMASFTRTWALELAADGVTVNAVAPGPTATELFEENNPEGSATRERYVNMIPMGRLGRPEDMAAAVAFLCSEDAAFITGQVLHVDGGASVG